MICLSNTPGGADSYSQCVTSSQFGAGARMCMGRSKHDGRAASGRLEANLSNRSELDGDIKGRHQLFTDAVVASR